MSDKKPNRLINEKSPYLLQHAYNPVDWHPWGDDAFEEARKKDKPIFLSIGYSTCHWCHVMEKESFEDEEVAGLLNDTFVCIKVDREERPDIDINYMAVCQMLTGSGGWPLTIVMTPDKKPFFAATYIPKHNRFGRIGMLELVPRIKELWLNNRNTAIESADKLIAYLKDSVRNEQGEALDQESLHDAFRNLTENYDEVYGGFGTAPKFPMPHYVMFLLRYWKRTGSERALFMVENTLWNMRAGGIFDHIGFGFHRYSTDPMWLVPHFEKMLYDQALLAVAYCEAYQATGKKIYKETVQEILTYVLTNMTSREGAFFSAEDADSEGEEGKFYVWTQNDIKEILGEADGELVCRIFNVSKEGNFIEESTQRKTGTNILFLSKPLEMLAKDLGRETHDLEEFILRAREILYNVREKRVHPHKDEKILCDWNGLMIAALAKAAQALNDDIYKEAAKKAVEYIFSKMVTQDGRLYHRIKEGEAAISGFLDDYVFMTWGLIELYEATFEAAYLQKAIALCDVTIKYFWDKDNGGFFFTAGDSETVLVRNKELYDGAIPSGNSLAMYNLLRLGRMTVNYDFEEKAEIINRIFSKQVKYAPQGYAFFLCALDFAIGPSYEIVVVGKENSEDTKEMLTLLQSKFIPRKVLLFKPESEKRNIIENIALYTKELLSIDGRTTAYICENYQCKVPVTDVNKLLEEFN